MWSYIDFIFWGGVLNCLFLEPSVLLFQADMFVLQAWGIVLILDFPSLPSRIGSTAPSCPLGVDPASFLNSSLAFLEYIIIKLPEKDYARDKLSDSMNSQKYLYLAISLNFLTGKVKPLKHLNRGNLMEKIGYINNGRAKKPNKEKGNAIIRDCGVDIHGHP